MFEFLPEALRVSALQVIHNEEVYLLKTSKNRKTISDRNTLKLSLVNKVIEPIKSLKKDFQLN